MHDNEDGKTIVPLYAFRKRHLKPWHVLSARCFRCDHEVTLEHSAVMQVADTFHWLDMVEERLRCTKCGNRAGNFLKVDQTGGGPVNDHAGG